ncbi:hypothetical protein M427DRAFT_34698 [Gonapodya prolifera JEL478]|uniref:Uncharacterized protein n=1 Tax=Gonapodya prolifera (strain JEL478) TaxID=1344416 RepID=A0A139A7Z7_GONPJ|nr:hypothetical protein M427DRAFT_34698 [Gonapodya prolifera JEL478]|eukprot:KXS12503.1 hypothetical protein M427DRAFT_34698 [Gonapodya prolifera JEL478]
MSDSLSPLEIIVAILSWLSVVCAGLTSAIVFRIAGSRPLVGVAYLGVHLVIYNLQQGIFTSTYGFLMLNAPVPACYTKRFFHTYGSVGYFVSMMTYSVEVAISIMNAERAVYRSPKRSGWVPPMCFVLPLLPSLLSVLPQIINPGFWRDPDGMNCHLAFRRSERWEQGTLLCTGLPIFLSSVAALLFFCATFHRIVTARKDALTSSNFDVTGSSATPTVSSQLTKPPKTSTSLASESTHDHDGMGRQLTTGTTKLNPLVEQQPKARTWFNTHLKAVVISKSVLYKLGSMCIVTALFGVVNGITFFVNGAKIAAGNTFVETVTVLDAINACTGTTYFLVILSITEVRRAFLSPVTASSVLKSELNTSGASVLESREVSVRAGGLIGDGTKSGMGL